MGQFRPKHEHLLRAHSSREAQPPHKSGSSDPPPSAVSAYSEVFSRTGHPPNAAKQQAGPHSSRAILPLDLLPALFDSALEELHTGRQRVYFALAVLRVSRGWRIMAQAHSALWATILIDDQLVGVRKLVELFLFRAGTRPLDIVVYVPGVEGLGAQMAFKTVLAVSTRWRSLTYAGAEVQHQLHRLINTLREVPLPQLEALHLAGGFQRQSKMQWSVMRQLVALPALRSLRFSGVRLRYESALAPRILLSNLTTLELDANTVSSTFRVSRLRDIVRETPKLQRLALGGFVPWVGAEEADLVEPVLLPSLRYFQVHIPGAPIAGIFGDFAAPALEHLVLRPLSLDGWQGLNSFLGRSGQTFPSLRILQICNMRSPVGIMATAFIAPIPSSTIPGIEDAGCTPVPVIFSAFQGFYSAMPALNTLILEDVDDAFPLRGLDSATWSHEVLWAELSQVSICGTRISQLCGHVLVNLVRTRQEAGRPLSTLRIQDTWLISMDREWLRQLEGVVEIQPFTHAGTASLGDADW